MKYLVGFTRLFSGSNREGKAIGWGMRGVKGAPREAFGKTGKEAERNLKLLEQTQMKQL